MPSIFTDEFADALKRQYYELRNRTQALEQRLRSAYRPTIREDLHALGARVEVRLTPGVAVLASYRYERYILEDWQQGSNAPWVEEVGGEFLLRDTSRSHQWGNRLQVVRNHVDCVAGTASMMTKACASG